MQKKENEMAEFIPRIMSFNDVAKATTLSRTAINHLRAADMFPVAIKLGERRIGFVRTEIEEWIQARIDLRDIQKDTP